MESLDARIGIVSWNTADLLDQCLAALPAAVEGLSADVVVVDNASGDDSVAVARKHDVRVIRNGENVGYARGINQALHRPWPPALVAVNPDTVPPPGSITGLVRRLLSGPADVALVVPALRNADGTIQHSVRRFPSLEGYAVSWFVPRPLQRGRLARRLWLEGRAPHDRTQDIDWAIGAVHVLRSAALEDRNPYDERWFMYVEDIELCWWLAQRGWRRQLDASISVTHVGNAAGLQAWGDDRERRYMCASYDWYARDIGRWKARGWAALNAVGVLWWSAARAGWYLCLLRRKEASAAFAFRRDARFHLRFVRDPGGR